MTNEELGPAPRDEDARVHGDAQPAELRKADDVFKGCARESPISRASSSAGERAAERSNRASSSA